MYGRKKMEVEDHTHTHPFLCFLRPLLFPFPSSLRNSRLTNFHLHLPHSLVFQSAKGSNATHDPLRLVCLPHVVLDVCAAAWYLHPHDKVRGMASGREHAGSREDFV